MAKFAVDFSDTEMISFLLKKGMTVELRTREFTDENMFQRQFRAFGAKMDPAPVVSKDVFIVKNKEGQELVCEDETDYERKKLILEIVFMDTLKKSLLEL